MTYENLYSELGKLLYAIADIDEKVSPQEKQKLLDIVKNELVPLEQHSDKFGTSTGYYSEFEFNYLDNDIADAESAFESFINYLENHSTGIDKKMKKLCIKVAKELAAVYYGTNKKEAELIKRLQFVIKKLHSTIR